MPFSVRPLKQGDHDAWLTAWRAFRSLLSENAIADDVARTTWARFMDPAIPMHVMGAFDGEVLLGFVQYLYHYSANSIEQHCYLQTLYTAPDSRGRGVGRALIEAVYAAAQREGSPRVYWQMHADNTAARLLYEKVADRTDFVQYRKNF